MNKNMDIPKNPLTAVNDEEAQLVEKCVSWLSKPCSKSVHVNIINMTNIENRMKTRLESAREEKYLKQLRDLKESKDTERAHCDADTIIMSILSELGYDSLVEEWSAIEKWYA